MPTRTSTSSIPKPFRCGQDILCCTKLQKWSRQRQLQQKRRLQLLSHRERLALASFHNALGFTSIAVGILMFITMVTVLSLAEISWQTITARSVILLSWGFGMGLGCSFVMVFAESSRNFQWATQIQAIDEELQETDTISTEEDAELIHSVLFFSEEDECDGDDFSYHAGDDGDSNIGANDHNADEDANDRNDDSYNSDGDEQV